MMGSSFSITDHSMLSSAECADLHVTARDLLALPTLRLTFAQWYQSMTATNADGHMTILGTICGDATNVMGGKGAKAIRRHAHSHSSSIMTGVWRCPYCI